MSLIHRPSFTIGAVCDEHPEASSSEVLPPPNSLHHAARVLSRDVTSLKQNAWQTWISGGSNLLAAYTQRI